ncbi:gasdermin-D-like [Trachemys scripta elegans]|uniref:gasdermin-D-like n=1 Tax=Trachemys scripta elegans TaxID=31138 RepID=UPI0015549B9A|nr:gasdermin-D-like [Trachemys scripta elegans]
MFARAAKQLTKELDSDRRFIPISSLASADSYRPFSLVMKKQSRLPWPPRKYLATSYKLTDVFKEGTAMDAEVKYDAPLRYSETTDQKVGVKISLKLQPTAVDSGGSWKSSFSVSQITVRKAYMVKKGQWKIDTSHKFIKRFSGSHRIKLYVVTEAFEIKEPLLIEERSQGGGKVMITAGEIGEIQGQGESIKKKTMEIPQGTVVAYVVQPLDIQEEIFLCSDLIFTDLDFRVLPLLVTCIEKNMVAKQLALMDGIMEWILSSDKESIFSLASSLPEEEKNITAEMMNTCGLIPQTDTPSLTYLWNKEAQSNLTALYAALYALWILSE